MRRISDASPSTSKGEPELPFPILDVDNSIIDETENSGTKRVANAASRDKKFKNRAENNNSSRVIPMTENLKNQRTTNAENSCHNIGSTPLSEIVESLLKGNRIFENGKITIELKITLNAPNKPQSTEVISHGSISSFLSELGFPETMINNSSTSLQLSIANENIPSTSERTFPDEMINQSPKVLQSSKPRSKPSSSNGPLKGEVKKGKLDTKELESINNLFKKTMGNMLTKNLLSREDVQLLNEYLNMDKETQFFIIKLFLSPDSWFVLTAFCEEIGLFHVLSESKMYQIYQDPKVRSYYIDTDIRRLDLKSLLELLGIRQLRRIEKKFKVIPEKPRKEVRIRYLIDKINERDLRNAAIELLGFCIKLRGRAKKAFYKAYILQTYCIPSYYDIKNYLKDSSGKGVVYPEYHIENYTPFKSRDHFSCFFEAISDKLKFISALKQKDMEKLEKLCRYAFEKLRNPDELGKWDKHERKHLHEFSAEYQYINILSDGTEKLTRNCELVTQWLTFLINHYPRNHNIAFWYRNLTEIMIKNAKNYERAAEFLIRIYEKHERQNIDNLPIIEFRKLAEKLRTTRSYNVCKLYCDKLFSLSGRSIDINNFPQKILRCDNRESQQTQRIIYSYNNEHGDAETIALKYYESEENLEGVVFGRQSIEIIFTLLFWDIIYRSYVPLTFISDLQCAPLDMYSTLFYENRKQEINDLLRYVASETKWPTPKLEQTLKDNWKKHSHEKSIVDFQISEDAIEDIWNYVRCMDRRVLSKILERLARNFGFFRKGFPNLLLWNAEKKRCKFVKVRQEQDELQSDEILWIQYLRDVQADVEICCLSVPDIIPKKKTKTA